MAASLSLPVLALAAAVGLPGCSKTPAQQAPEDKRLKVDVSPIGNAEVLAAIARIAAAQPELLAHLKKLIGDSKSGG